MIDRLMVYAPPRLGMSMYATDSTNYRLHGPMQAIVDGEEVTIPEHLAEEYRKDMASFYKGVRVHWDDEIPKRTRLFNAITLTLAL